MSTSTRAERQSERWRQAALTGQFGKIRDMLNEIITQDWPQQAGHHFIREYGRPGEQSEAEDRRDYADFAADLYLKKYFHGNPAQRFEHRDAVRGIANAFYDSRLKEHFPVTAEGAQANGVQMQQDIAYFAPGRDGKSMERSFGISLLNIGAHNCTHCGTNTMARMAQPDKCDIIDPDSVFKDRMEYFGTAMHELAHSVRSLSGELKYETLEQQRREESIATVFQGLMQAKVFGAAGMLQMRMDIAVRLGSAEDDGFRYEAVGPMIAAVDFIDRKQPAALARMSPRQLMSEAVKLVDSADLAQGMTPEQQEVFRDFLKTADLRPEIAGTRRANLTRPSEGGPTEDGPTRTFTIVAQLPQSAGGGYKILHENAPYLPQMAVVDAAFERYGTLDLGLRQLQMRLNPMRPAAMARDEYRTADPSKFYDPKWQAALFDFNKGFNHPSCDILGVFRSALDELTQVLAESRKGPGTANGASSKDPVDKNAPETVTIPAELKADTAENTRPVAVGEDKQTLKKPPAAAPGADS